jgi:hypothetical protein
MATPTRPDRPPPPEAAAVRPAPPGTGPARPPRTYSRPPPPGYRPWGPPSPAYYPPPYWWGYGWGYGYYPLFPRYAGGPYEQPAEPAAPGHAVASTLRLTGAFGPRDSGMAGLAFAFDGPHGGLDLGFDALAPSRGGVMETGFGGTQESYGLGSAHLSFPLLQAPAFRLRLQAGGSWLAVPASTYGGSANAFGLDVGASASLGLVGPLGVEGHARITPFPIRITDLRAAVALRVSSLSLLGGYRVIDVEGDPRTGPAARFEGPEFGFGLIF